MKTSHVVFVQVQLCFKLKLISRSKYKYASEHPPRRREVKLQKFVIKAKADFEERQEKAKKEGFAEPEQKLEGSGQGTRDLSILRGHHRNFPCKRCGKSRWLSTETLGTFPHILHWKFLSTTTERGRQGCDHFATDVIEGPDVQFNFIIIWGIC